MEAILHRLRNQSIFFKLFSVLIFAGIVINAVVLLAMLPALLGSPPDPTKGSLLVRIGTLASKEILANPTKEKALSVLEDTGIFVSAEGAVEWSTAPQPIHGRELSQEGPIRPFLIDGITAQGPVRLIFTQKLPEPPPLLGALVLVLSVILVLLISSYAIRKILTPIGTLVHGVEQVARGNLDYRIEIKSNDEIARLANAFNLMAERLKELVERKEQLLFDVSHELRSPLSRTRVAMEFMPSNSAKENIREDLQEMEKMIHELLENARLRNSETVLQISEFDIVAMIADLLKKYEAATPRPKLTDSPQTLTVRGDRDRIRMVTKNLIENAIKYSPQTESVEIAISQSSKLTLISVTDHGIGIAANECERIFEPFYRIDKSRSRETGGFGLGLSLCQKIVQAHGGTIRVESKEGAGTRMTIEIPRS